MRQVRVVIRDSCEGEADLESETSAVTSSREERMAATGRGDGSPVPLGWNLLVHTLEEWEVVRDMESSAKRQSGVLEKSLTKREKGCTSVIGGHEETKISWVANTMDFEDCDPGRWHYGSRLVIYQTGGIEALHTDDGHEDG
ncbi:hypothetical protein NDU88_004985 [Pleurodeles waltl]|uniref:Uncharacterized protein n=1 Tax=Pleurodeles waltl TaxID=8319 RepID=A0AAV7VJS5_PLEWA|nr:hypothetical protein NDU88_004985 [Pleurodeles waltl]